MPARWKHFKCQRCGKCCEVLGLPFDGIKIRHIADFLGLTPKEVIEKYYADLDHKGKQLRIDRYKVVPCPFLSTDSDGGKSCGIYPVRPRACQAYPLNTKGEDAEVGCPAYEDWLGGFTRK